MADIRIKDLATTASTTASDDFMAVDGTTNGTRKLSAATPSFATSVTVPGVAGPTATNLTLAGGSTGASLVLGQGTTAANASITPTGTGSLIVTKNSTGNNVPGIILKNGAAGYTELDLYSGVSDTVKLLLQASDVNSLAALSVATNHPLLFGVNASEKMRIATTGNVLIGGTTDITGSGGLKVFGTTAATGVGTGALQVAGGIYSGANSVFAGDRLLAQKDQNAVTRLQVRNDTSGTAAQSQVSATLGDFTTYTAMGSLSAGFTTSGLFAANAGYIASNATAGLNLFTVGATSLTLGTNSTAALTLASGGAATFAGAVTVASASPSLALSGSDSKLLFTDTGVGATSRNWAIAASQAAEGDFSIFVSSAVGGDPIFGTKALGFDRTGAATFAGAVTVSSTTAGSAGAGALVVSGGLATGAASYFGGNLIVANDKFSNFDGSGAARMGMQSVSVAPYSVRMLGSADAVNTRDFSFGYYTGDNAANAWNQKAAINSYTGAATFAGAVAIGNTVNTVSPTSPNRTVTMVIGGVTYYLAAKTTND